MVHYVTLHVLGALWSFKYWVARFSGELPSLMRLTAQHVLRLTASLQHRGPHQCRLQVDIQLFFPPSLSNLLPFLVHCQRSTEHCSLLNLQVCKELARLHCSPSLLCVALDGEVIKTHVIWEWQCGADLQSCWPVQYLVGRLTGTELVGLWREVLTVSYNKFHIRFPWFTRAWALSANGGPWINHLDRLKKKLGC